MSNHTPSTPSVTLSPSSNERIATAEDFRILSNMWTIGSLRDSASRSNLSRSYFQRANEEFFEWVFSPERNCVALPLRLTIQDLAEILDSDSESPDARKIEKWYIGHFYNSNLMRVSSQNYSKNHEFDDHAIRFLIHLFNQGYFECGGTEFLRKFED